jgi:hypothetical protein
MKGMKAEQLNVIAIGMGYKDVFFPRVYINYTKYNQLTNYNPLISNDQMVEIINKFILKGWMICAKDKEIIITDLAYNEIAIGKTINEAVCKAAYQYFKD